MYAGKPGVIAARMANVLPVQTQQAMDVEQVPPVLAIQGSDQLAAVEFSRSQDRSLSAPRVIPRARTAETEKKANPTNFLEPLYFLHRQVVPLLPCRPSEHYRQSVFLPRRQIVQFFL